MANERTPQDKLRHMLVLLKDTNMTDAEKLEFINFSLPILINEIETECNIKRNDFCQCEKPDVESLFTYCNNCHKHVSD